MHRSNLVFYKSSSVLAQKAAPPEKRKLTAVIIVTLVGVLCLQGSWTVTIFGLLMMGVGGYGIYNAVRFNAQHWPDLYQRWLGSWLCHKCGHNYHQS